MRKHLDSMTISKLSKDAMLRGTIFDLEVLWARVDVSLMLPNLRQKEATTLRGRAYPQEGHIMGG